MQHFELKAEGVSVAFGGQQVLTEVDFVISSGQIALLRGLNGSGKTTLLNILSGFLKPDAGTIHLHFSNTQVNITNRAPHHIVRLGIGRLWQDIRLFPTMTVLENVLAASPHTTGINPAQVLFSFSKIKKQERAFKEQAMQWLEMLGMADRAHSSGDKLSIGQAKRVAIARMLQTGSKLLLLDEPLAGLDQDAGAKLVIDIHRLTATGHAMLVVEHNHEAIMPICHLHYSLDKGVLTTEKLNRK